MVSRWFRSDCKALGGVMPCRNIWGRSGVGLGSVWVSYTKPLIHERERDWGVYRAKETDGVEGTQQGEGDGGGGTGSKRKGGIIVRCFRAARLRGTKLKQTLPPYFNEMAS